MIHTLGWQRLSLLLIIGSLLILRSPQQSLLAHDEGYYALQARWIVETGDWITPQWWGEPRYDRTIGIQWLIAASYTLFGINEWSARLPTLLACTFGVLLTYEIGSILLSKRVAWLGALILCVTSLWLRQGLMAAQDMSLVLIELVAIWALLQAEIQTSFRRYWGILAGSTLGLGFLIKGFMIFLPPVALLPYLIGEHRRHQHLFNPGIYLGLFFGWLPVVTWLGLSYLEYGALPLQQLFGKLFHLGNESWFGHGPEYYFWNIPANAFPWPLFTLMGVSLAFSSLKLKRKLLLLGYPISLFLELTFFNTRTPYYALQLMPFMALFAGLAFVWLSKLYRQRRHSWVITLLSYSFGGLGALVLLASLVVNLGISGLEISAEIQQYSLLAFILGVSWLMLPILWWKYQSHVTNWAALKSWLIAWFVGPFLVMQSIVLMGLWGNYNPEVKAFFQQPTIQNIVENEPIDFVASKDFNAVFTGLGNPDFSEVSNDPHEVHSSWVLLSFYTPHWGEKRKTLSELPVSRYAWISPEINLEGSGYQEVSQVREWKLIYNRP